MVQKIHPRGVIWVPSSSPPVVILGPSKQPMQRPSIRKSMLYPTLETNKQHANVIEDCPLPLGMNEVERQML